MPNNSTNLLPRERRHALVRDYFLRLGVIIVILVTLLALVSIVLLAPTYVLLSDSASAKESRLTAIASSLSAANGSALSARLEALTSNAVTLSALASTTSPSATTRSVLGISHPGITLSGFSYAPALSKSLGTFTITGNATTRDSLRSYQLALAGAPFVRSADLPVSAFAKDSDIAFTISVALVP